jgi:uncharacterized damage-inducible protein DinB
MDTTRKVLERVPAEKLAWKPHDKSMTLGRLASHIAELPGWAEVGIKQDEFDMAPPGEEPPTAFVGGSTNEILESFDKNRASAREVIASTADQEFMRGWTFKSGGETVFTIPKIGVVRTFILNHLMHHRGQLTVYLRLTGAKVPSVYGPTADEAAF